MWFLVLLGIIVFPPILPKVDFFSPVHLFFFPSFEAGVERPFIVSYERSFFSFFFSLF